MAFLLLTNPIQDALDKALVIAVTFLAIGLIMVVVEIANRRW